MISPQVTQAAVVVNAVASVVTSVANAVSNVVVATFNVATAVVEAGAGSLLNLVGIQNNWANDAACRVGIEGGRSVTSDPFDVKCFPPTSTTGNNNSGTLGGLLNNKNPLGPTTPTSTSPTLPGNLGNGNGGLGSGIQTPFSLCSISDRRNRWQDRRRQADDLDHITYSAAAFRPDQFACELERRRGDIHADIRTEFEHYIYDGRPEDHYSDPYRPFGRHGIYIDMLCKHDGRCRLGDNEGNIENILKQKAGALCAPAFCFNYGLILI